MTILTKLCSPFEISAGVGGGSSEIVYCVSSTMVRKYTLVVILSSEGGRGRRGKNSW